jgi:hypothetical protein
MILSSLKSLSETGMPLNSVMRRRSRRLGRTLGRVG